MASAVLSGTTEDIVTLTATGLAGVRVTNLDDTELLTVTIGKGASTAASYPSSAASALADDQWVLGPQESRVFDFAVTPDQAGKMISTDPEDGLATVVRLVGGGNGGSGANPYCVAGLRRNPFTKELG